MSLDQSRGKVIVHCAPSPSNYSLFATYRIFRAVETINQKLNVDELKIKIIPPSFNEFLNLRFILQFYEVEHIWKIDSIRRQKEN